MESDISDLERLIDRLGPVENWTNLKKFSLGFNQLTSLPPEVRSWTNIISIYLYECNLTSLPPEVKFWTNLKTIVLWNNQLTSLPLSIIRLTKLRYLYYFNSYHNSINMIKFISHYYLSRLKYLINYCSSIKRSKNLQKVLGFDGLVCDLIVLYL